MKQYRIGFYTKNKATRNQLENFIQLAQDFGYSFKHKDNNISANDAIDILSKISLSSIHFIKNDQEYFEAYLVKGCLKLGTTFLRRKRLVEYKHTTNPDIISILDEFLELTDSFLLDLIDVTSDIFFFSNFVAPSFYCQDLAEELNIDFAKKQINEINGIHAYVFISKTKKISDSLEIIDIAEEHDYQFINNLQNNTVLNFVSSLSHLEDALEGNQPITLYLKSNNFMMKLVFNGRLVSLYPIEPFKMKPIKDETSIDIAFYLTIYLNLFEPFGVDDLVTTFNKKIGFDIEFADKFIKIHLMPWTFVEDFYRYIYSAEKLHYLKNLEELLAFDPTEADRNNIILEMKNFVQQVSNADQMAKKLGKDYIFHSPDPIPSAVKNWFKQKNIKFKEKKSNNW